MEQFVKDNLGRHKQFALATVDETGSPWVVCLNLAYDEKFNIIWKSSKETEHSRHITKNPYVSVCVFSETEDVGDFGFYAKAIAHEVTNDDELNKLIVARFTKANKPAPNISELSGDSPMRLYYAEIQEAWANDDRHLKVPINIGVLRNAEL